jgi:ribulose-phosphate 3-epimerase
LKRLCPSILNADRSELQSEISKVSSQSDLLHLDIMDGIFVPNSTFTFDEAEKIIKSSALPVDVHLMISNPDEEAVRYAEAGASSVTFHFEASSNPKATIERIRRAGSRVGIALKPGTSFAQIAPYLESLDMVLVMTVEPGFGGQSFMGDMMGKVEEARREIDEKHLDRIWLQVDGGINLETIVTASKAGADTFVAGSAVFSAPNPGEMVLKLRAAAEI